MADYNLLEKRSTNVSDTTDSEVINVINNDSFLCKHRVGQVWVNVDLSGGSVIAFDQFDIQGLFTVNGTWITLAAAFGTPATHENAFILLSPDALDALAHGASGIVMFDASGLWAFRLRSAQAGVTAAAVTRAIEVGGQPLF